MSELFVLLWLADAIKSLQILNTIFLVLLVFAAIIGFIYLATEEKLYLAKNFVPYGKWAAIAISVIAILPSPTTVRALVAVKVGDYAVHSPLGEKAIKTLDTILDKVIEDKNGKGND
jgi:hypothetical protein